MSGTSGIKNQLLTYFEYFMVCSFLGWIYESIWWNMIEENKGFLNRGFLFGPWIPIYGVGIVLILLAIKAVHARSGLSIFCVAVIVSTVTELLGSYMMEMVTGSFMWDYTGYFGNFQGRIAVKPDLMFGFLTVLVYFGVLPKLKSYQEGNQKLRTGIDVGLGVLFAADFVRSLAALSPAP